MTISKSEICSKLNCSRNYLRLYLFTPQFLETNCGTEEAEKYRHRRIITPIEFPNLFTILKERNII